MPQARIGDLATCVGPPDVIAKGSASVIVSGSPAARMGDNTAHGGVIVIGAPTVIIGDSAGGGGGGMSVALPVPPVAADCMAGAAAGNSSFVRV
jgi:hypothetical protein